MHGVHVGMHGLHAYILQGPRAQEQKGESPCVPFGKGAISAIGSGASPARGGLPQLKPSSGEHRVTRGSVLFWSFRDLRTVFSCGHGRSNMRSLRFGEIFCWRPSVKKKGGQARGGKPGKVSLLKKNKNEKIRKNKAKQAKKEKK